MGFEDSSGGRLVVQMRKTHEFVKGVALDSVDEERVGEGKRQHHPDQV